MTLGYEIPKNVKMGERGLNDCLNEIGRVE